MSERYSDPDEFAAKMKDRLRKIRENPQQALFSEFKGTSRDRAITVHVDMMGRLKGLNIAPGAAYEGGERELVDGIMHAYRAAQDAANVLDFNLADLARELNDAPNLKAAIERGAQPASGGSTPARAQPTEADDDAPTSWLR